MEVEKKSANPVRGVRWPPDLIEEIERTAAEDDRDFSKQVFHLARLGLEEQKLREMEAATRKNERIAQASGEPPQRKSS